MSDTEIWCWWCGKKPSDQVIVVTGPGTAICELCVELVSVIITEEKKRR